MAATGPEGPAATAGNLQNEIRQSRPFRSASEEAVLALLRTSDDVLRHIARAVDPHGITVQQYNVLRILRGAGDNGLPTLDIASRMLERTPGITRLIDKLEARGLVARQRGAGDRRQVLCRVTRQGLELVATITPDVDARVDEALAGFSPEEARSLISLLALVRVRVA